MAGPAGERAQFRSSLYERLHPREELLDSQIVGRLLLSLASLPEVVQDGGESRWDGGRWSGVKWWEGYLIPDGQVRGKFAQLARPMACHSVLIERAHDFQPPSGMAR